MDYTKELNSFEQEIELISSITAVLSWDQQCVMPSLGNQHRAEQLTYLANLKHEKETSDKFSSLLKNLEEKKEKLTLTQQRSLELSRRNFDLKKKIPANLVSSIARESSLGNQLWQEARKKNDDSIFLPQLEKIIGLSKEKAKCLEIDSKNLYNNLLSPFNWNMNCNSLDIIFGELKEKIPPLLNKVIEKNRFTDQMKKIKIKIPSQEKIGQTCLDLMGFNPKRSQLNLAAHPFSITLGPDDYRITTRYDTNDFSSSLLSSAHEMGHSLYEQGLPKDLYGTPQGQACSLGVHESQSLFWEKKIVASKKFLSLLLPTLTDELKGTEEKVTLDQLYSTVNQVKNSLIRVDSDEVSYCLHVIIRYEMEKLLINEDLPTSEIKSTWNQKYQQYLGITPPDAATSFLQDVHWSWGEFGYFPSYAIGHLISSQIEEKMNQDLGPLANLITKEKIPEITSWLRRNVHEKGFEHDPNELIKNITGKSLSAKPFLTYLENKFIHESY